MTHESGAHRAHLDDTQLLELYAESLVASNPTHPHLTTCEACAAKFRTLGRTLGAHVGAERDLADAFFTPDRLARQRGRILQRLEASTHLARILPFPMRAAARGVGLLARHSSRSIVKARWLAAAAAAGLIIGVSAGRLLDLNPRVLSVRPPITTAVGDSRTIVTPTPVVATILHPEEESFLEEIEAALLRQPAPELYALDAFTPRTRDLIDR